MWIREVPSPLKVVHMRHPSRGPPLSMVQGISQEAALRAVRPYTGGQLHIHPGYLPTGKPWDEATRTIDLS